MAPGGGHPPRSIFGVEKFILNMKKSHEDGERVRNWGNKKEGINMIQILSERVKELVKYSNAQ